MAEHTIHETIRKPMLRTLTEVSEPSPLQNLMDVFQKGINPKGPVYYL